jgi:hypothetical protein
LIGRRARETNYPVLIAFGLATTSKHFFPAVYICKPPDDRGLINSSMKT